MKNNYINLIMNNKIFTRIACAAFTIAAISTVSSCSLFQQANMPHFSGEGKCPVCGTVISKHPVEQKSSVDKEFLKEILSKDYSIKEYKFDEGPKRMVWKDDTITETQDNLIPHFKSTTVMGQKSIVPLKTIIDNTENDVFLYFTEDAQGYPKELRMRIQYYADDPLNYNKITFMIDGFDYDFVPVNIKRGKGDGIMIWEQSDDSMLTANKDLVYALSHCQYWAQCRLQGEDGMTHVKLITKEQIVAMKRTVQLYLLRGGSFK